MRSFEWAIEDVEIAHPGLYLDHCAAMAVAIMSRLCDPPCEFVLQCEGFSPPDLEGDDAFLLRVSWDEPTRLAAERIWQTEQPKQIVEGAAVAPGGSNDCPLAC